MTSDRHPKIVFFFSIPITIFVTIVSYAGLFIPETYPKETANWQAQALAQDIFDLFLITPLLLITSWLTFKKSRIGMILWSGIILYVIYTFVLFCFAIHFNYLFIIYCLTLGLSFYAFLYFLFSQRNKPVNNWCVNKVPIKTVGYFFIILAVLFYFLWMSEIVPAILNNTTPATITDAGLITNPVHVLDLSVLLPGLIFVAINLLKKKSWGLLLAPVALTFMVLMDIAIAIMVIVMDIKGFGTDLSVAVFMVLLAIFSLILLIWYIKSIKPNSV